MERTCTLKAELESMLAFIHLIINSVIIFVSYSVVNKLYYCVICISINPSSNDFNVICTRKSIYLLNKYLTRMLRLFSVMICDFVFRGKCKTKIKMSFLTIFPMFSYIDYYTCRDQLLSWISIEILPFC